MANSDAAFVPSRSFEGHIGWLHRRGVKKVTVHHIAATSHKRVRDVEVLFAYEGIHIDLDLRTVAVDDVLRRWPNA